MRSVKLAAALLAAGVSFVAYSAHAAGDLNVICSADPEVCDLMKGLFEKQSDIKVNMVRLSAGETYAKIRAEARNPKTDIWWAGTGDPHLQAAAEGLTQEYKSPLFDQLQDWAKKLVGAESYVYTTLRDGQAIVFRVSGRSRIAIDTELVIAASAESLHFFDSDGNTKDRRG